jgi:tetratricopeptide (TPR) repeat protein
LEGKAIKLTYDLPVQAHGDLAPRAWAELAIAQLSELDDPEITPLIVAYAQHYRIPNKHCSFLVLETDAEYKQYGLEEEQRTRKLKDVAQFIAEWLQKHLTVRSERDRWMTLLRQNMQRIKMLEKDSGRAMLTLLTDLPDKEFELGEFPASSRLWSTADVPANYLRERMKDVNIFDAFTKEAKRRLKADAGGAVRALSCIVELHPNNPQALRLVGYYLMSWQRPAEAARVFLRVLENRPFEPHSYRDLARALLKLRRYALAASLYEIVLAGQWHERFGRIHQIASEEYALFVQAALRSRAMPRNVAQTLRQRSATLGLRVKPSQLRVTVTWNTDNTDIDLWVIEPTSEKCYYSNKKTKNGGTLLEDITRGYGPERYQNIGGTSGQYKIQLHFYGHSSNVLGNETHASTIIVIHAGTPKQRIIEKNFVLKKREQIVNVAKITL